MSDQEQAQPAPAAESPAELAALVRSSTPVALGTVPTKGTIQDMRALAADLSTSDLVPSAFQNRPRNCFFALELAIAYQVPILVVMKALYVPKQGQLGIGTEFLHAQARKGLIRGPVRYEYHGGDWTVEPLLEDGQGRSHPNPKWLALGVTASATDAQTGDVVSNRFDLVTAWRMGWAKPSARTGEPSNYMKMPRTMCENRAVSGLVRKGWPHALHGMMTDVEAADESRFRDVEVEDARSRDLGRLNAMETPQVRDVTPEED